MIRLRLTRQFRVKQPSHTSNAATHARSRRSKPRLPVFIWLARTRRTLRHWYRNWATLLMFIGSHLKYKVETHGLENFSYDRSTIITCAHKRDVDIPVVIPVLYFLKQPRRLKDLRGLYFPARDDLYERGFLIIYFPFLNRLRFLLRHVSVARHFWIVQACPVKLPDEQTVNQLLNETMRIEGNLPLQEALTPEWSRRLIGEAPPNHNLHLKDAILLAPLPVLAQYSNPRMFAEPLASRIRERHHRTIMGQLRNLTRILDKGGSLFIAPEGRVTPDGRFGKMRAAFTRIVQQSHVNLKMLPINLTYDFMDTERPKVIVNIGPQVNNLNSYSKTQLAELVKQEVASLAVVTMSGLASQWLIETAEEGREWVLLSKLRDECWQELRRLQKLGFRTDSRLNTRQGFEQRLERFIAYGYGKGQLFLNTENQRPPLEANAADSSNDNEFNSVYDHWLHLNKASLLRTECNRPDDNPARYSYNELMSLLETKNALPQPTPLVFPVESDQRTAG